MAGPTRPPTCSVATTPPRQAGKGKAGEDERGHSETRWHRGTPEATVQKRGDAEQMRSRRHAARSPRRARRLRRTASSSPHLELTVSRAADDSSIFVLAGAGLCLAHLACCGRVLNLRISRDVDQVDASAARQHVTTIAIVQPRRTEPGCGGVRDVSECPGDPAGRQRPRVQVGHGLRSLEPIRAIRGGRVGVGPPRLRLVTFRRWRHEAVSGRHAR